MRNLTTDSTSNDNPAAAACKSIGFNALIILLVAQEK